MDGNHYLEDVLVQFGKQKNLLDKAVAQISPADFFMSLDDEGNSIAVIVKHMAGNMRSRWTDFLTSDGEKPDRNRDSEFVIEEGDTRESLLERLDTGWKLVADALTPLTTEDLMGSVTIRGEPHTVIEAVNRQLSHYAYHVGQIVQLARHFCGDKWQSLSIPRGESEKFLAERQDRFKK